MQKDMQILKRPQKSGVHEDPFGAQLTFGSVICSVGLVKEIKTEQDTTSNRISQIRWLVQYPKIRFGNEPISLWFGSKKQLIFE